MAATEPRTEQEVRAAIRDERHGLASSLEELRTEIEHATNLDAKLSGVLPVAIAGALGAGFFLGGGIGATIRLLMRRSRQRDVEVKGRAGRFALVERR
jgi:hypothetical protein